MGRLKDALAALDRRRRVALMLAIVIATGMTLLQDQLRYQRYDLYNLPDFDPWVYLAMAERPSVFTVGPWGYRLLKPALLHALAGAPRQVFPIDRMVNIIGLSLAGVLLFLLLRRWGHGAAPALLAVLAWSLVEPFALLFDEPFLTEAVSLPIALALLLAVECEANLALLALLMALGALSKELFLFYLPLVYLTRVARRGRRGALIDILLCALPSFALLGILKSYWAPQTYAHQAVHATFAHIAAAFRHGWETQRASLLLSGLLPLALIGALRAQARPFLGRYGYLLLITVLAPFFAFLNAPRLAPYVVGRHMIYAMPFVLPLALIAIDRVYRHIGPAPPAPLARRYVAPLAAILLFVLLVMPFAALDRYRRLPLHETLLGPYVLTTCRESVRAARHLDLGEEIVWDLDAPGWSWATSDAADMGRMRWYLRDGFGKWPWDTTAPGVVMEARTASFVLPALGGKGVTLALELSAKAPAHATIALNGRYLGAFRIEAARTAHLLDIPAERLIHGDNLAALSVQDGDVALRPRLHRITLRPAR